MAIPTFAATPLLDIAERMHDRGQRQRVSVDHLPGVNGAYAQIHGTTEKTITVTGKITDSSAVDTATALLDLRDKVRATRDTLMAVGAQPFIDAQGKTYASCILLEYYETGPYFFRTDAGPTYVIGGNLVAQILVLDTVAT